MGHWKEWLHPRADDFFRLDRVRAFESEPDSILASLHLKNQNCDTIDTSRSDYFQKAIEKCSKSTNSRFLTQSTRWSSGGVLPSLFGGDSVSLFAQILVSKLRKIWSHVFTNNLYIFIRCFCARKCHIKMMFFPPLQNIFVLLTSDLFSPSKV